MTHSSCNLFAYGTLMFEELVHAVTRRTFRTQPALLHGFRRFAIRRLGVCEAYPAIKPDPTGCVQGRLLLTVDPVAMKAIRRYENDPPDYQLITVQVCCGDDRLLPAVTYAARACLIPHLQGEWDEQAFQTHQLRDYIDRYLSDS